MVIRNYNGEKVIDKCVASVLKSTIKDMEVIVVDDASNDKSPELVETKYSKYGVKVIKLKQNVGPAAASNVGVYESRGKYVAFLDNDTEVSPNWLEYPLKLMEMREDIAVIQPLLLKKDGKIDSVGHYFHTLGQGMETTFLSEAFTTNFFEVFGAKQAAMIVRLDALKKSGGFDERYFFYFEDTDLCWRLRLLGYKIVVCPRSVVYHEGGHIMSKKKARVMLYRERNSLLTMIKNYSLRNLMKWLPLRLILDLMSVCTLFIVKKREYAFALIKAVMQTFSKEMLREAIRRRAYVQKHVRRFSDSEILKNVSISNVILFLRYLRWRISVLA